MPKLILEKNLDNNTLTLAATFIWAILWVLIPDKVMGKRPGLKRIFFGLGILLAAASLFVLLTQHG